MKDWKTLLKDAVKEKWRPGQCFLIAQVKPLLIANEIVVDELLGGRQMRAFLKAEVPELDQIFNEQQPTNWGLVPEGEAYERPYAQYFAGKSQKRSPLSEFPYQNAMRIAFGKSIADGMRRFLLQAPARFVDLPLGENEPNGVEVSPDDLAVGGDDAQIAVRISAWLGRHALAAADYQPTKSSLPRSPKPQATALHDLIDLIPSGDLDRVTLPLDVVRKLLEKPGNTSR